jgi:hypothetical protein
LYDGAEWVNGAVATLAQLAAKLDVTAQQVYGAYDLLKNNATAQVINGVTAIINADLTITLNGTVGSNVDQFGYSYVDINTDLSFLEIGKTYYLSGCPSGGSADTYYLQLNKTSPSIADFGNEAAFTVASGQTYNKVRINMKQGMTFNNHVFKPMIALQSGMPYVPCVMTNRELTDRINNTTVPTITPNTDYVYSTNFYWEVLRKGDVGILKGYAMLKSGTVPQGNVLATIDNVALAGVCEIALIREDKIMPLRVRANGQIIAPAAISFASAISYDIMGTILFN